MDKYPRGSEWRRWDLHFHTPSSYDVSNSITNEQLVKVWKDNSISVIAITDHHEMDIKRISELKVLASVENITVLPGIEFLSDARGREPIHFIGIFSENCDYDYIWGQISNRTKICDIKGNGKKHNEVYCDLKDTISLIKELGGIVTIHAGKKSNSIENITDSLPHGEAQKKDIADIIDIFEMGKEKDLEDYRKFVFSSIKKVIPMVICSDNHDINNYSFKQKLWIKANPTFEGLKQAINEPNDRFYVGDEPDVLTRVYQDKTRYISSITIDTVDNQDNTSQVWFKELNIQLNKELVAIIGNKGSGKSAVSDIISLCSDAKHKDNFLFLHKDKFRKKGYADRFNAYLEFESGMKTDIRPLNYDIVNTDEPKVQYLPQNYFEKVCNEIGEAESFRNEIENVVFQYIPEGRKLKTKTFKELINFQKSSIDKEIILIKSKIEKVNSEIISLEDKRNPEFKKSLQSKLKTKEEELRVHEINKPIAPINEAQAIDSIKEDTYDQKTDLIEWKSKLAKCQEDLLEHNTELAENNLSIQELLQFKRDIMSFEQEYKEFIDGRKEIAEKYLLDPKKIIKVDINISSVTSSINSFEAKNTNIREILGTEDVQPNSVYESISLEAQIKYCEEEIKKIMKSLSNVEQEHQKYLSDLNIWNEKRIIIIGTLNTFDSIEYLKHEIKYLDNSLIPDLIAKREKRILFSIEIYKKKHEIKEFYDDIKEELSSELVECKEQNLNIQSSLVIDSDFEDNFSQFIDKGRSGSFYGKEEGKFILKEKITKDLEWDEEKNVSEFFINIIEFFEIDQRDKFKGENHFIGDQVHKRNDFYSFLFSLDYLKPIYELRKNKTNIELLSPGEKGALLLVFYLVLDKSTIPLIIDQPEDNLDNNSVATVLVPYIKEAKKRRQIIIVTHNPNLAVVADAEQVIRVNIDKNNGNKFSYVSGGIEDPIINKEIVNILEGTMPAFKTRKQKYND